jgi:hypothetical protein
MVNKPYVDEALNQRIYRESLAGAIEISMNKKLIFPKRKMASGNTVTVKHFDTCQCLKCVPTKG